MKILYLCTDLGIPICGRKGASVHVRALAAALHHLGHSVIVAAPQLNKSPWEEPAPVPFRVIHVPPSHDAASAVKAFGELIGVTNSSVAGAVQRILYAKDLSRELKRQFSHEPPDFIYERGSLYSTTGVTLAAEFRVPLLLELNAPLAMEQETYRGGGLGDLARRSEQWTLARANAVLAVSAPLRDYVVSVGVEAGRVHVVPNGVDPELFAPRPRDPAVRRRFHLNGGPVIGFVGGLRPWHGADALPALVERLVPRHRDLQLVVVGNGPLRTDLEQDLAARGIGRHAVFTGSVPHDEVSKLVTEFDVALVPYAAPEHAFYFSPLKLFESMASGVPVVASAIGQIEEIVCDRKTGLLCPPGDLDAMTAACDQLLDDSALRQRLGQAAADEVRGRYTWQRNAERVVELGRRLIESREACP
jgi:glycosyltransferase involved in cell wall biosynthesis